MKHPTSRMLHAYWDHLRGQRCAPERSEIEPGAIRNLLADSMILETDPARQLASVRLAGTRVCALFAREIKGAAFADLWGTTRETGWPLVEAVTLDTVGLVAGLCGLTARGETVDLELLLLPLRHRGQTQARVLGSLSPQIVPDWLGTRPVTRIETVSVRVLAPQPDPGLLDDLPPPANDTLPVRRGHLLVHQGGRV